MNSKEMKPEISDALVRRACEAYLTSCGVETTEEEKLPEEDEREPILSAEFTRRLQGVLRGRQRPRWMRSCAAAVLVVFLTAAAVFTMDVEARDDMVGWFRGSDGASTVYQFQTPVGQADPVPIPQVDPAAFAPTVLPEGWAEQERITTDRQLVIRYTDAAGKPQYYTAAAAELGASLLISGAQTPVTVAVGEEYAEFYPAAEEGQYQLLVWQDSRQDMLYILSSTASKAQMIKLAESVREIG